MKKKKPLVITMKTHDVPKSARKTGLDEQLMNAEPGAEKFQALCQE